MTKRFDIQQASKSRFEFAFNSAFSLATIRNKKMFCKRLETDRNRFNMQYNWNISVENYHTHLANIVDLTLNLWYETRGTTE